MLREWAGNDENRIEIECGAEAWKITLSMPPKKAARGVGKSFAEAWDNINRA